jgi:ABC-type Fe3+-hydroxamate transport system substrate-binding protein
VLLVALLASACAGGDDSATETVTVTTATTTTVTVTETTTETTTTEGASGTLPVDAFNARAESVDEPWERDLAKVTDEFLALGEQESGSRSFQSTSNGDSASASLLIDGLADDSVRARSYELTFTRRDDGTWKVESAQWAQRCHEGRGHQDFSPEPCV